ncbi:MAG: FdhF/YdeP family oxidoreductase [Gammaproteobacteria bacterium]
MKREIPGVRPYRNPAGGWGALRAVANTVREQMDVADASRTLLHTNQPDGFDCPGCAWPDKTPTSTFQFCENGAKAVTWEATRKRVTPEFFATHTVSSLLKRTDFELESEGRITHPMAYDPATDTYRVIEWGEAFQRIGAILRSLPDPNMAEFYTSGRASNEAAFLYQLFAREFGTNNFPDCSNMCHEATSVGLPRSIGIGKGTVSLDDFDHCELLIAMGHNPGTNHPRMMGTLHEMARRGVPVIVFNPLKERALERFADPQDPIEMGTLGATPIATSYYMVKVGGDAAAMKGVMKAVLALDGALDMDFISTHTRGFEALRDDLQATRWQDIEAASGLKQADLERVAVAYARSNATIVSYGMGITQHIRGTANVQQIANLLLLRGNYGKPGAGICPLRGHSNVQGDRSVGITERPTTAMLDRIQAAFGFAPPRDHGHDAVGAMEAIIAGRSKALVCLGGNLAVALSDSAQCYTAVRSLDLSVHIGTRLNRSHLLVGKESFLLPCLGRTERDAQAGGEQSVTVEDSMSMVHASRGRLLPASPQLRSEPAIVAGIAQAAMPASRVPWSDLIADYDRIRAGIEAVFPDFADYNTRIRIPGGFRLPLPPTQRVWPTSSGKAEFLVFPGLGEDPQPDGAEALKLTTLRSHDQYNTTIYGLDDRYRGIFGRRDVLFMNEADLTALGLEHGDVVDVESVVDRTRSLRMERLTAVAHDISRGSVATYYPEANVLVPLGWHDADSGTPSYKCVPVRVSKSSGFSRNA